MLERGGRNMYSASKHEDIIQGYLDKEERSQRRWGRISRVQPVHPRDRWLEWNRDSVRGRDFAIWPEVNTTHWEMQ